MHSDDDNGTVALSLPHGATLVSAADRLQVPETNSRQPRWSEIQCIDDRLVTPTCTLQKSVAFALILHKRLGNRKFGHITAHEIPVEIVRTILELAVGTIESSCFEYEAGEALFNLMMNHRQGRPVGTRVPRSRIPRNYWNVPFVVAAAHSDKRFRSRTGLGPELWWLLKFMHHEFFRVPMVTAVPRKFYKKITGTRANQDPLRPAFAGCKNAALVRESAKVLHVEHSWLERMKIQTWLDAHDDLFRHSQRFYLCNQMAKPCSNFIVFSVRNPGTKAVPGVHTEMHRPVDVKLVTRWLQDLWGDYNVNTFVRVRELSAGLQIFVCGTKILPWIDDILHAELFQQFGHVFPRKAFIPL